MSSGNAFSELWVFSSVVECVHKHGIPFTFHFGFYVNVPFQVSSGNAFSELWV